MAGFAGTWERVSTENFEAHMNVMGVPAEMQKLLTENNDTMTISVDGNTWAYNIKRAGKENSVTMKVGEVTQYKNPGGHDMTGIIKSVGDKVVEEHFMGDTKIDLTREVINGQLCMTVIAKGVTAKVFYNRK